MYKNRVFFLKVDKEDFNNLFSCRYIDSLIHNKVDHLHKRVHVQTNNFVNSTYH